MSKFRVFVMMSAVLILVGLPTSVASSEALHWPASALTACRAGNAAPGGCDTSGAQRQVMMRSIFEQYGIVVADRTAQWSVDEVASLQQALASIAARFSAIAGRDAAPTMKLLLQSATFYRDNTSSDRIAYTLAGQVSVYNLWSTYDQTERTFYLAHEMGHLLDTRTSFLHLFMGEESDEFARAIGAFTDEHGRYQLGQNFPHHDSPRDIRHRSESASEDWAESFATVMVPEFEPNLRDIGIARQAEVMRHLARWSDAQGLAALTTSDPQSFGTQPLPNSIGQPCVAVPPASVRILHQWKVTQDGELLEYRDENLGTIIAPDLILTHHSFYSMPQPNWSEETYTFEDERGRSVQWQPRSLRLMMLDDNTMLIRLPAGAFSDRATVADRTTVNRLAAGAWLTITYWDDVTRQFMRHDFQIVQNKNGLATLADPDKHINRGDSGGGAFWQGQLVGNTKLIYADGAGNPLGLFTVALVPARISQP